MYKEIFEVGYNFFRLFCKKIIHGKKIKYMKIQLISPKSSLEIKRSGKMILKGIINTGPGSYLSAGGELQIGDHVYVGRNSMIVCRKRISIGDWTTIGPNVVIYDHDHDLKNKGHLVCDDVEIGKNVWIGANVLILKGTKIGDNTVIAAGSVVTKNIPENSILIQKRTSELVQRINH